MIHDISCTVNTVNIGHATCRICDYMQHVAAFRRESVVLQESNLSYFLPLTHARTIRSVKRKFLLSYVLERHMCTSKAPMRSWAARNFLFILEFESSFFHKINLCKVLSFRPKMDAVKSCVECPLCFNHSAFQHWTSLRQALVSLTTRSVFSKII